MTLVTGLAVFLVGLIAGVALTILLRKQENPLEVPLEKLEHRLRELEEARAKSTGALDANLRTLGDAQRQLLQETSRLSQAL